MPAEAGAEAEAGDKASEAGKVTARGGRAARAPRVPKPVPATPFPAVEPGAEQPEIRPRTRRASKTPPAVVFRPPQADARQENAHQADTHQDAEPTAALGAPPAQQRRQATPERTETPETPEPAQTLPDEAVPPRKKAAARKAAGASTARKAAKKAAPAKKATPAKKTTPARRAAPAQAVPVEVSTTEREVSTTQRAAEESGTTDHVTDISAGNAPIAVAEPGQTAAKVPLSAREPVLRAPAHPTWWSRVPTSPGYAPELLALAAVDILGPRAQQWAAQMRATYPMATEHGLARLALHRFTRAAAVGGVAAQAAGLFAPVLEMAALARAQANLVLHLAAAHGIDPTDRERAVDLLVLTRVQPSPELARAALALADEQADERPHTVQRATEAAWRVISPLAAQTAGWLAVRALTRSARGLHLLAVWAGDAAATERLAHRAIAHYRKLTAGAR